MEHLNCRGFNELDKRLIVVETEQSSMKDDITEIKQSLKESRILTITILASSLAGTVGTIFILMGGA
jgi:hypothetical protein